MDDLEFYDPERIAIDVEKWQTEHGMDPASESGKAIALGVWRIYYQSLYQRFKELNKAQGSATYEHESVRYLA